MLTPDLIANASSTITAQDKMLILMMLKKNPYYQLEVVNSGDTASAKIDAATSLQKQALNALVTLTANLGSSVFSIQRDEDALVYGVKDNLAEIGTEMFFILYNWAAYLDPSQGSGVGIIPDAGIFGDWAAIGQRNVCTCNVRPCSCLLGSGHKPRNGSDICFSGC